MTKLFQKTTNCVRRLHANHLQNLTSGSPRNLKSSNYDVMAGTLCHASYGEKGQKARSKCYKVLVQTL